MASSKRDRLLLATRALFEQGRLAWPALEVPFETFSRLIEERGSEEAPAEEKSADLYLACACAAGVPGAIEAFDRAHLAEVGRHVSFMGASSAFIDEVRQIVREKLFVPSKSGPGRITEYTGEGALASWVKVIAVRTAIDLQRRGDGPVAQSARSSGPEIPIDPELAHLKLKYREAFNAAFRHAISALSLEQQNLLRSHYVEAVSLEALAAKSGVHRATVARWIASARRAIIDEARRQLEEQLGASDSELESLIRVMRSQIDLTLPGLLHKA